MPDSKRVVVLDSLAQEGLDLLSAAEGIEFEVRTGLAGDQLREVLRGYDGAVCRSGVKITPEAMAGNRRLRAIVRAGVGTDNIDLPAATRQGIVVMNTPTGNTLSTAEHALALMLGLSRNLAPANQSLVEGRWDRKKFMGTQLADKTLGIVGLGRIGQAVASRAKSLQMQLVGYDPFLSAERAAELGVELVAAVRDMLPRVDYLTVHTPLTDETRDLISFDEIDLLKPGARLINCARGGIYNEAALIAGLESGKLGGVAVDVYPQEPCTDSPLFGRPKVLCTPHLGASTEEAQINVAVEAVQLLVEFLSRGAIRHSVNMTPLDRQKLAGLRQYLDVAHRLGQLLAELCGGGARTCRLHYRGEVAEKDTKLLTSGFAAGLLTTALEEDVNIVNAGVLMHERGIELVEECSRETGDFSSVITAEVVTEGRTFRAGGTLFGTNMVRLVTLDDYRLEAYLDGILLIFHHSDVPGIIGRVGTIFGQHQVNIAQMAVGRAGTTPGGGAIGVLNLDSEPPAEAIDEVLQHADIQAVQICKLPPAGELPAWLAGS